MGRFKRRAFPFWAILAYAAAIVAPACVWSEPEITVEDAVALALRSNLGIRTEQLTLAGKRLTMDTAWNRFVPSLTAGVGMLRMNVAQALPAGIVPNPASIKAPGVYDQVIAYPGGTLPQWGLGVTLQAQLTLSVQMFYGVRQTVLDYEAGVTSLERARADLERDVRKQFYNLLLLEQSIKLQEQAIATATARLAETKANYQNGLVDEYTYLSAQVSLENLRPVLDNLTSGHEAAVMAFDQSIGLRVTAKPTLVGSIQAEVIPINAREVDLLIAKYIDGRYDLEALHQSMLQTENLISVAKAGFFPTLTLGYTLDPTFMGDPLKDPLFADIAKDWKQVNGMFSISIGLRLDPLLPKSQTRVQLEQYRNQLKALDLALERTRAGAEIEVRSAVRTLEKTRATLDVKKLNARLAQRALDLAETGYRSGARDLLDVRSAEQDLQRAQLDVLSDQYAYVVGLLDLQSALNATVAQIKEAIHENQTGTK